MTILHSIKSAMSSGEQQVFSADLPISSPHCAVVVTIGSIPASSHLNWQPQFRCDQPGDQSVPDAQQSQSQSQSQTEGGSTGDGWHCGQKRGKHSHVDKLERPES